MDEFQEKLRIILSSIEEMSEASHFAGNIKKSGRYLLRLLLGTIASPRGAILVRFLQSNEIRPHVMVGMNKEADFRLQPEKEVTDYYIKNPFPHAIASPPATTAHFFDSVNSDWNRLGLTLVQPMTARMEFIGFVCLGDKISNECYNESDYELIRLLSHPITNAYFQHMTMQKMQKNRFELNRKVLEMETLYEVGLAINSLRDIDSLMEEVLVRSTSLLDARHGLLVLRESSNSHFSLLRSFGIDMESESEKLPSNVKDFLGAIKDKSVEEIESPEEIIEKLKGKRLLIVPLRFESKLLGFLCVCDKEERHGGVSDFSAADERLLSAFANLASVALENTRLQREAIEKERLAREMELAAEIQKELLPESVPKIEGYSAAVKTIQSLQVGGDFYDVLDIGEGRVVFAIADVTGKGVPAGLLVSTLHAGLHLSRPHLGTPVKAVSELNRLIYEASKSNKFISMALALLDTEKHTLTYVNAGHNHPILISDNNESRELGTGGLILGVMPDWEYKSETIPINKGDVIVFFTDGLAEARNPEGEEFGNARILEAVNKRRELDSRRILEETYQERHSFTCFAPLADDTTIMILKREK